MCPFFKSVKAGRSAPSCRRAVRYEPPGIAPFPPPAPSSTAWRERVRRPSHRPPAAAPPWSTQRHPPAERARPAPCGDPPDAWAAAPVSSRTLSDPASFAVRSTSASQQAKDSPERRRAMWRPLRSPSGLPPWPPHRRSCCPPPPGLGGYDVPARFRRKHRRPQVG